MSYPILNRKYLVKLIDPETNKVFKIMHSFSEEFVESQKDIIKLIIEISKDQYDIKTDTIKRYIIDSVMEI